MNKYFLFLILFFIVNAINVYSKQDSLILLYEKRISSLEKDISDLKSGQKVIDLYSNTNDKILSTLESYVNGNSMLFTAAITLICGIIVLISIIAIINYFVSNNQIKALKINLLSELTCNITESINDFQKKHSEYNENLKKSEGDYAKKIEDKIELINARTSEYFKNEVNTKFSKERFIISTNLLFDLKDYYLAFIKYLNFGNFILTGYNSENKNELINILNRIGVCIDKLDKTKFTSDTSELFQSFLEKFNRITDENILTIINELLLKYTMKTGKI